MMKLLSGEKAAMPPITVDIAPQFSDGRTGSSSSTTTTRTYNTLSAGSPHIHSPASSISPGGVRIGLFQADDSILFRIFDEHNSMFSV